MKSITKFALVAVGVTLAGAAVTASGIYRANRAKEEFMQIPQITNEEELSVALEGPKQIYCMTNMNITGTPAEDPLGILQDDYLYIQYIKEVCEKNTGANTAEAFKWEYATNDMMEGSYASDLMLFEEYEVDVQSFIAIMNANVLTPEMVKAEYAEKVDGAYYPNEKEDYEGNIRYAAAALPMGAEAAMYATVGDGQIILEYNEDGRCCIVDQGTAEDLRAYYGDKAGTTSILIGLMFIAPMGLLLLISVIIFSITGAIATKSEEKKKAARRRK